jgi:cell division protease FtsH
MVTQYGMTERLGAVRLGENESQPFLGRDIGHARNYSEAVAAIVDEEINKLISQAHQEAFDILSDNRDVLDALVEELLEKETLDKAEVAEIFEPLRRREIRPAWTGSETRIPSTVPPVKSSTNGRAPQTGHVIGPDTGPDAPMPGAPDDDLVGEPPEPHAQGTP